jgi:hypothetical protein
MKKKLILYVVLTIVTLATVGIVANAYSGEDLLYTKYNIFGLSSLNNDINNDGTTNVLDVLELKHTMLKDATNMRSR